MNDLTQSLVSLYNADLTYSEIATALNTLYNLKLTAGAVKIRCIRLTKTGVIDPRATMADWGDEQDVDLNQILTELKRIHEQAEKTSKTLSDLNETIKTIQKQLKLEKAGAEEYFP